MLTRKDVRYSINRCKAGGVHPEKYQKIFDKVMETKPAELNVNDFPKEWDIIITKTGKVEFVTPEKDVNYIRSVCVEAKVYASKGLDFDEFNDRQRNIIGIIENSMLEGKMEWSNYGTNWIVNLDTQNGLIETRLLHIQPGQVEVTEQMILASQSSERTAEKISEEGKIRNEEKEQGISYDQTLDLSGGDKWQTITEEEFEQLEMLRELRKKKKGNGE